jgi:hypothetical protein
MTNSMTIVTLAFMGNHALALQASPQVSTLTLQASPQVITKISMTLLDKPSEEKQRVLDKVWPIKRCVGTQMVALATCKKELKGLGNANTEYSITALFSSAKEKEFQELKDELMVTLEESGCFSLDTVSLLIKLNAKANEKKTIYEMIDPLANFQAIQNGLVIGLIVSVLGQGNKA